MSGLLGPDGRPIRRDAPLLVDAYGRAVRAGATEALPVRPRLRPLEILPFREGDREGLLVRDPAGVAEGPAVLRLEVLPQGRDDLLGVVEAARQRLFDLGARAQLGLLGAELRFTLGAALQHHRLGARQHLARA